MKRLRVVEDHLKRRQDKAIYPQHSLFKFINQPDSFAARYFLESRDLQLLQLNIQSEATRLKNDKTQECARRNAEYRRQKSQNDLRVHDYSEKVDRWGIRHERHSTAECLKCVEQRRLTAMKITVFEWLLPEDPVLSRLVVFELQLPRLFGIWRDITYLLGHKYFFDILCTQQETPTPILRDYPAIRRFFSVQDISQKITIASNTKSFLESHYRECGFPCVEAEVVKGHPLQYELYHVAMDKWIRDRLPITALRGICCPKPLSGPYKSLS